MGEDERKREENWTRWLLANGESPSPEYSYSSSDTFKRKVFFVAISLSRRSRNHSSLMRMTEMNGPYNGGEKSLHSDCGP